MAEKPALLEFDHGITAIDTGYVRPQLDASHLIVRNGRAAFVDTGTTYSVPMLLATLEQKNIAPEAVDYVLLTHVHLDHAGGAGALMQQLPNATALVHPRGAAHIIDPAKLIAGTKSVYGEAEFERMYGEIPPIAAERVVEVTDDMRVKLGGSELRLIHTPGHALHHYCIVDADSNSVFTGDTFGISYRVFDSANGAFIFPATTPVHFDPKQAHASLDRILSFEPEACFLTHYSRVTEIARLGADMHRGLDKLVEIAEACANQADRLECMKRQIYEWLAHAVRVHGCALDQQTMDTWLEMDVELNAQGLSVWLDRTNK